MLFKTCCVGLMIILGASGFNALAEDSSAPSVPGKWIEADRFEPAGKVDTDWWREFGDPVLDSLIAEGVKNNYDVSNAAKRVRIARNTLSSIRGGYLPTISLDAGWNSSRSSAYATDPKGASVTSGAWQGAVSMNWEIDVFGRVAASARAQKARWNATRSEYASVMLSVEAQIAEAYLTILVQQNQLVVADVHSKSQMEVVKMTEARYESGLASKLDVEQARRVYYSTIASIPLLENNIRTGVNALAVLLGCNPETLYPVLAGRRDLPEYVRIISVGVPMNLLSRRPDVEEARKQVEASAEAVGIARKDYLPVLSLTGSIGTLAHSAGDLFAKDSYTYSIAPTISWTLFDGLQRRYSVANAKEQLESDVNSYNLAVATAVEEADNAMSGYLANLKYIKAVEEVIGHAEESLRLAIELYKVDLTAFSNVVDAQLAYLESQNTLVEAKGNALKSLVSLYKALGGGWDATLLDNK